VSADCSPQWSIENEIRTIPGLGSFTAHTVAGGLLGFSRCKWINSHPPAVCHHFGGRALLHRRHANGLEIERPPFINAGTAFRGGWLTSAVVVSGSSASPMRIVSGLIPTRLRICRAAICVLACCYRFLHSDPERGPLISAWRFKGSSESPDQNQS
jgi:hypothetical protein